MIPPLEPQPGLARQDLSHHVDVLPGHLERLAVRSAVPPLHHLRTRHPQSEEETPPAQLGQSRRGHGGHRRGARRHLHDGAAQPDAFGGGAVPGEHAHRITAVGLGHPHRVIPEAVRFLHQLQTRLDRGPGVAHVECQAHTK